MKGNLYKKLYEQIIGLYNILVEDNFVNLEFTGFTPEVAGNKEVIKLSLGTNFLQLEADDYSIWEYFELLKKGKGIVLLDGTILQLYYEIDKEKEKIVKHSLIVYPPPFINLSDLDPDDLILLLMELNEKSNLICNSSKKITKLIEISNITYPRTFPLRFDYDKHLDRVEHPASHCHLIHPENRIPLSQPLTPKKFFKAALQLTNPSIWQQLKEKIESIQDLNEEYLSSHTLEYNNPLRLEIF